MGKKLNTVILELTTPDALELANFIEDEIFNYIRNDTEINNIRWLCHMTDIWKRLTYGIVEDKTE